VVPTALAVREDGSVVVVNGKGHGTGANPIPFKPSEGDITDRMRGSIQLVATPDAAMLSAGKTDVDAATDVGKLAGARRSTARVRPTTSPFPRRTPRVRASSSSTSSSW